MQRSDILDGSKMLQQSAMNDLILRGENDELRELSNAFLTISENNESKGDTAEAFRQQILDYKNLIDSAISANTYDISDNTTAYFSFWDYYFDGDVIIQNQEDALAEKARDEASRDYHHREWLDSYDSVLGIFTGAYHFYTYQYYCACVSSDQREYEYWKQIEGIFDDIKTKTTGLFANSVSTRNAILLGLSDLQDNFVDGNYNVDLNANWRLKLLEAFKEYFYTEDEAGNKTYDYDLIFDRIENADELSDSEYQALLDTLSEFGIVIGTNEDRGNLKDKVYEYLRGEITNTDGSLVACPYNALTYEERSLYVRYAEDLNPDWEDKMSGIYETFEADNYPGWEEDITNIKFLVYTAEEPYQSLFLDYTEDMVINDLHFGGTSHFTGEGSNEPYGIYINVDHMDQANLGAAAYTTFFHELGHLIDYNIQNDGSSYSRTHQIDGQSLTNVLEEEVRNRIEVEFNVQWENYVNSVRSNPSFGTYYFQKELYERKIRYKAEVEDYIMNEIDITSYGTPYISDPDLRSLYTDVVNGITSDLKTYSLPKGNHNNYASDIYGGFTGNTLCAGYGHPAITDQWSDSSSTYTRLYWIQYESENNNRITGIDKNGTGFVIRLDNGDTFSESHDFLHDRTILQDRTKDPRGDSTDEDIIHSSGNVVYNTSTASEMVAEYFSTNMTRDPDDNRCFDAYSAETIEYMDRFFEDMARE